MSRRFAIFPALLVVLSGCVGGPEDAGEQKSVPTSTLSLGEESPDTGKIIGRVVDDEEVPVEGAKVGILGTNLTVTTDAAGGFAFSGLTPGTYSLLAAKLGFEGSPEQVKVQPGSVTEKVLKLLPLPSNEPFVQVREKRGNVTGLTTKDPVTNNGKNREYRIEAANDDWKLLDRPDAILEMVAEIKWQNTQVLGEWLRLKVGIRGDMGDTAKFFVDTEGPSPLRAVANHEKVLELLNQNNKMCKAEGPCEMALEVNVGTGNTNLPADVSLGADQPFTAAISLFYRMNAPAGYSYFA